MPDPSRCSRYTHRVGISNRRLLELDRAAGTLIFDYKDYADQGRHKSMRLPLEEFIRRLRLHFLPPHFVKIRHYGLLANRGRQERLQRARALLPPRDSQPATLQPRALATPEPRPRPVCPHCGWAALVLIRVIPPQRWERPPTAITDTS